MQASNAQATTSCQVLVIGGGPAGSTAATLLARRGYRVMLLEKERHPRFHIGESLLPMNLPIFERLGVLDKVRALGVHKNGAEFEADNARGYNTFDFVRSLGNHPPHAYQVLRQDFDAMLFEHARASGVDAREAHRVTAVEQHGPRASIVRVDTPAGERIVHADYVLDASGRDTLLARTRKLFRRSRTHQSAALFGHYRGVQRRPGEEAGNIGIYRFEHGWMWLIPLPDGLMSAGAVCRPAYLKQRRGGREAFLRDTLEGHPVVRERMRGATLVEGSVHASGNYSYDAAEMGGPGWMLIGDAFAFLDPVFSTGVFLAMHSAELAADVVDRAMRDPSSERRLQRRMEKRLRAGMKRVAWFIHRFTTPSIRRMFRQPRNVLGVEHALIAMLAGDIFDSLAVRWRLRVFRMIHVGFVLSGLRAWRAAKRDLRQQARTRYDDANDSAPAP